MTVKLNQRLTNFSAAMTSHKTFTLSNYVGKNIILYFYPRDNTPGCTEESIAFRDLYSQFQGTNSEIFGISRDTLRSHESFKSKLDLPFELISDPDEIVCSMFNVMKMKNMYGKQVRGIERSTFLIDGDSKLMKEWRGVKASGHANEVLAFLT